MKELQKNKVFVQIGVFDGYDEFMFLSKEYTPTKVILVEPNSLMNDQIKKHYKGIRNVKIENVAIWEKDNVTVELTHPRQLKRRHEFSNYNPCFSLIPMQDWGDDLIKIPVPGMRFMTLCEKHGITDINYLQIDTEGYDAEIIKMIDFSKVNIDVIVYENWDFPRSAFLRHGRNAVKFGQNAMRFLEEYLPTKGYVVERKNKANYIAYKP